MISINQYIKLIEDYLKSHKQINTVLTSNEADFNAYDKIVYPVAHIDYVTQKINGNNISHQFEIIIADLFNPNIPATEFECYSDCNLIADDVITYFENQLDEEYEIDPNTSIQKFSDANVDRVAGAVFVITFNQFREANNCITPTSKNIDLEPSASMYYGAIDSLPTFEELAELDSSFTNSGTLNTGLNNKFLVAVLAGKSIDFIIDESASDLDLTLIYEDAGQISNGTLTYNFFVMEQALNYSENHKHHIKIS